MKIHLRKPSATMLCSITLPNLRGDVKKRKCLHAKPVALGVAGGGGVGIGPSHRLSPLLWMAVENRLHLAAERRGFSVVSRRPPSGTRREPPRPGHCHSRRSAGCVKGAKRRSEALTEASTEETCARGRGRFCGLFPLRQIYALFDRRQQHHALTDNLFGDGLFEA
jgi:hypothetical protein